MKSLSGGQVHNHQLISRTAQSKKKPNIVISCILLQVEFFVYIYMGVKLGLSLNTDSSIYAT